MNNTNAVLKRKISQGWAVLGAGLLLLALSFALPALLSADASSYKWVGGFGILLIGWGGTFLARYLLAARSPQTARRTIVDELDERNRAIRHQAGNLAFMVTFLTSSVALIIYSAMTRGQPADALWFFMAALVIVPSIVYVIALVVLNEK